LGDREIVGTATTVIVGVLPPLPASGTTVTTPVIPEVNDPVRTPLVILQLVGAFTTPAAPVKVQAPLESDANPTPLTVITLLVTVMGGERVTSGRRVKAVVPLSLPQVTVIVYAMLPVLPTAFPTLKEPYTVELKTCATAPVTRLPTGPVIVQLVPFATVGVTLVAVTNITSPDLPEFGDKLTIRAAACTCLGGAATVATETNSAEVRSSTMNREQTTHCLFVC